ncbi:MAG: aminoacyl-tRNA hydrolase [Phycisphaerales bacterium]|nr:aminoacyl-tRNA hydrolase [Phycisphaerales bacterium]
MAESPDTPKRPENAIRLGNGVWAMPDDLRYAFSRSSGPGGQNVNKVSTKVELRVRVSDLRRFGADDLERLRSIGGRFLTAAGELIITSEETRSQLDNREAALARLKALVTAATTRPKTRRKTKPTRGSKERRLKDKKEASQRKNRRNWKPGD